MFKVRDELLDGLHDLRLGEVVLMKDGLQFVEEGIDFQHRTAGGFFHHAKGFEAVHIDFLAGDVELFVGFLTRRVALEIDHGIGSAFVVHICSILLGIGIAGAFFLGESFGLHEVVADAAEGEHLVFAKFGEEHFAGAAQDAGEHTDLSALFRADEVALHVARCGKRLLLLQAVYPSVRQGAIAEGHIGEAGGRDLEMVVVGHHQVFHDALAGAHNVYRIGSLVGRDTEEVFGRELAEEVHQFLGLDVIVLNERLHAVPVFLAAHVLMGREVRHNVESPLLPENPRKDRIREVQRIAPELLRYIQSLRAPHIPHQLEQVLPVRFH